MNCRIVGACRIHHRRLRVDGDDAAIFLLFSFVIDIRMEKKCRGMESLAIWERYDNGSVRFWRILLIDIARSCVVKQGERRLI